MDFSDGVRRLRGFFRWGSDDFVGLLASEYYYIGRVCDLGVIPGSRLEMRSQEYLVMRMMDFFGCKMLEKPIMIF